MPTGWDHSWSWACTYEGCGFKAARLWRPRAFLHAWTRHNVWPWRWFEAIGSRLPHPRYRDDEAGRRTVLLSGWWWKP